MNNLSLSSGEPRRNLSPLPKIFIWVALISLLLSLSFSLFIIFIIHNAFPLILTLSLSSILFSLIAWNILAAKRNRALIFFFKGFPFSDLRGVVDGDIVKLSGRVSCGNLALESAYEKAAGCVYASTLLFGRLSWRGFFRWRLIFSERFAADFHLTESISGTRVTIRAGHGSKLTPLVNEMVLVNTEIKSRSFSLTLVKWLKERHLSPEPRALRLEEGYVKEGAELTVMGVVNGINDGNITIMPILDPVSTGCLWRKLLLPMVVDGLIFKFSDDIALEGD